MMYRLLVVLFVVPGLFAGLALPAWAASLTVAGTGSSAPLVRLLFEEFSKQAPGIVLNQISPPLGSGGALKALAAGDIDLAFTGRALKPEEASRFGRYFDLADTPFVFASSDGERRNGFTLDDLARVYAGSLTQWDSGTPIRLVLRASFESDTLQLKSMSPALHKAVDLAALRPGMVTGRDDLDTLAQLTQVSGTLGPTTLGLLSTVGGRLNVFAVNGVTPSVATLKSGAYPWRKTISVVLPQRPAPVAEKFAAFLKTEQARALLLRHEYLPPAQ